jgi:hypothetical protein
MSFALKRVRVQVLSTRLKAAESNRPAADKGEVLALVKALLDAIPALEDPAAHKG